jgi:hypothetical protein
METAVVRLSMPGGVGGQRCEPLPTRLTMGETHGVNGDKNTALKGLNYEINIQLPVNFISFGLLKRMSYKDVIHLFQDCLQRCNVTLISN